MFIKCYLSEAMAACGPLEEWYKEVKEEYLMLLK